MAFFNRVGSVLKQTVTKHIRPELSAPTPSLFQAIRSMSSSSKVFVGGLSYDTDEITLKEAFSQQGEVLEARIIMDRDTGRSRGFGFVTYASTESASNAIQAFDGQDLHGRRLRVNYATERPRGGSFGDGYGGGRGFGGGGGGYGGGYGGNNYGRGGYGGNNYGGDGNYSGGGGGGYGGVNNYPSGGSGGFGGENNYPSGGGGGANSFSAGGGGANSFSAGGGGSGFGATGDSMQSDESYGTSPTNVNKDLGDDTLEVKERDDDERDDLANTRS